MEDNLEKPKQNTQVRIFLYLVIGLICFVAATYWIASANFPDGIMIGHGEGRGTQFAVAEIKAKSTSDNTDTESAPDIQTSADDWPWWRGPYLSGKVPDEKPPVEWDSDKNVIWLTEVPGRGHSSPTVVGERVFLTTADEAEQTQSVVCFNRKTGEEIWQTVVLQGNFERKLYPTNTHATPTIACDGQHIFAAFLNSDSVWATALDLEGNQLWQTPVGGFSSEHGYASSPHIHGSLLFVAVDNWGQGYLAALNRKAGEIVWRKKRPSFSGFSSPIVVSSAGRDRLVLPGGNSVTAYDPHTGDTLWSRTATTETTVGTVVFEKDFIFASGGYPKAETVCINAGTGKIVWKDRQKVYVPSMIVHEGTLYAVTEEGIAVCWNAANGNVNWRKRLGGRFSASPILAGGNLYACSQSGETVVFQANPKEYREVARNTLGEEIFSTPAICGNQIFLRAAYGHGVTRREILYCIGEGG